MSNDENLLSPVIVTASPRPTPLVPLYTGSGGAGDQAITPFDPQFLSPTTMPDDSKSKVAWCYLIARIKYQLQYISPRTEYVAATWRQQSDNGVYWTDIYPGVPNSGIAPQEEAFSWLYDNNISSQNLTGSVHNHYDADDANKLPSDQDWAAAINQVEILGLPDFDIVVIDSSGDARRFKVSEYDNYPHGTDSASLQAMRNFANSGSMPPVISC